MGEVKKQKVDYIFKARSPCGKNEKEKPRMIYSYRVAFETDVETGDVVVSLPGLHHIADSGQTVEEALDHLHVLATGFIEVLQEQGETVPDSDIDT